MWRESAVLPVRAALFAERAHAFAEVFGVEAGLSQLDQLALQLLGDVELGVAELADDPLVPAQRYRRVACDLGRQRSNDLVELFSVDHVVDQSDLERAVGIDVAAREEELVRVRQTDRVQEL